MNNTKLTLLAILLCLTSCENVTEETYRRPETNEERKACAELIVQICAASNPRSDEEPEDMIFGAKMAAWETLCRERLYRVHKRTNGEIFKMELVTPEGGETK